MKNTQIDKSYNTDKSKCTIVEYEAGTHRKIRTIETLGGFAVYLSYKIYAETFFINAYGETKSEREKTAVFDNYYKHLFQTYKNKTVIIDILSNTNFLKETYKSEVENLEKFKKHIKYFNAIKNKDNFLQYCTDFLIWLDSKQTKKEVLPPQQTKTEKLKTKLSKFGFFDLPMVKQLSNENNEKLVEMISSNKLPYGIAMFDYLEFIKHLGKEHFQIKYKLNKEISKWFNSDKDGRAVKANISSLLKNTKEDKNRYTAYKHKETVIQDYEQLK